MAHTPGPWTVGRESVPFGGTDINITSPKYRKDVNANHVIASLRTISDQWEANANLIAAAPDLLAALKLLRNPGGDGKWPCYCSDPHYSGDKCENCVATEAINKAEGRTA